GRLLDGPLAVLHQDADLVRDGVADEDLAVPGGRDRTGGVVGISPGADDGRVADAAVPLVRHPSGRGPGGEVAVAVEGHRADGPERAIGRRAGAAPRPRRRLAGVAP